MTADTHPEDLEPSAFLDLAGLVERRRARAKELWLTAAQRGAFGLDAPLSKRGYAKLVGQRMQEALDAAGIQGAEMARRIGHANGTQLSLWVTGERLPPILPLIQFAAETGTSLEWLLGMQGSEADAVDSSTQRRRAAIRQARASIEAVAELVADAAGELVEAETGAETAWRELREQFAELVHVLGIVRERNQALFDGLLIGGARLLATVERLQAALANMAKQEGRPEALRQRIQAQRLSLATDGVARHDPTGGAADQRLQVWSR